MIQRIFIDEDGDIATIECDEEGLEYLIEGLEHLRECEEGAEMVTPTLGEISAPWWRFWNRSSTLVVGEFRLRRVTE